MNRREYSDGWKQASREWKKAAGACAACGSTLNLQAHHIIPLSKGGPNSRANTKVLCGACHAKEHAHMRGAGRPKVHKFRRYKPPRGG